MDIKKRVWHATSTALQWVDSVESCVTMSWSIRTIYFNSIAFIDISETEQIKWYDREEFVVNVNMLNNMEFQFDRDNFYLDYQDHDAMEKQLDEHCAMIEWKSDEEAVDILRGKYKNHYIRQKCRLLVGENKEDLALFVKRLIE